MPVQRFATLFFLLCTTTCYAHKSKFIVDSIDAATNERVRVIEHYIGDADDHEFGQVIMERKGETYFITFPVLLLKDRDQPHNADEQADDIMPKGSEIILKLDNSKIIKAAIEQDNKALWYYWWHFDPRYYRPYKIKPRFVVPPITKSPNKITPPYMENYGDLFGYNWMIKFEFTPADMLLMSRHNVTDAYIMKGSKKISLPIKNKQARRIRRSAKDLIHK